MPMLCPEEGGVGVAPESRAWFVQLPFLFTQKGLREAGSTTVQTPETIVVGGIFSSLNNNTQEFPGPSLVWPHPHPCPLSLTQSLKTPVFPKSEARWPPLECSKMLLRQLTTKVGAKQIRVVSGPCTREPAKEQGENRRRHHDCQGHPNS